MLGIQEFQEARQAGVQKLVDWFSSNDQFSNCEHLISILSSIVADESINCHNVHESVIHSLPKIIGNQFADV